MVLRLGYPRNQILASSFITDGSLSEDVTIPAGGTRLPTSPETLARTTLGGWRPGTRINLERSLRLGDELGGHLVSGHVDGVARIRDRREEGESVRFTIEAPAALAPYIASKGSVALDGISLTVVSVEPEGFTVSLIPHTLENTVAGSWRTGTLVNLEGDLVAKYVQRGIAAQLGTARSVVLTAEG